MYLLVLGVVSSLLWLLGMASTDLSKILKEDRIRLAWKDAYDIHVWGFHEAKYRMEDVKASLPLTEWLDKCINKLRIIRDKASWLKEWIEQLDLEQEYQTHGKKLGGKALCLPKASYSKKI